MICLDVDLNGSTVCRAGLGKHGLVHLNAAWHSPPPAWKPKGSRRKPHLAFGVGGVLYDRRPPMHENVSWANAELAVGDELRVRVVEANSPDEPARRERSERITEAGQWEEVQSRLGGCVRDLRRLKGGQGKVLARELQSVLKRVRGVTARQSVARTALRAAAERQGVDRHHG